MAQVLSHATLASPLPAAAETDGRGAYPIRFVSVVLPCLNEEAAVAAAVAEAYAGLREAGVAGEVVVVDNGSTDRSVERAQAAGARVIHEADRGYGAAHRRGLREARGDVVVMADADCTYDLTNLKTLLDPLRQGADLVIGNRLSGHIAPAAMPFLHRYLGTPVITRLLRWLTGVSVTDSQSGYRAFRRDALARLDLRAVGMEYASEMLLKAGRAGLRIVEVPTDYRARVGESKLRALSDGWRHLHLLLLLSPDTTLVYPGLFIALLGSILAILALVAPEGIGIAGVRWAPVYGSAILLVAGVQAVLYGALAAFRSPLTRPELRSRLKFLAGPHGVHRLLTSFLACLLAGITCDIVLLIVWIVGRSGIRLFGVAGLAAALVLIGFSGLVTLFASEYAREQLGW